MQSSNIYYVSTFCASLHQMTSMCFLKVLADLTQPRDVQSIADITLTDVNFLVRALKMEMSTLPCLLWEDCGFL